MNQETTTTVDADLRIDAFEYARQYRALKELGERIEAASKADGLHGIVFFDGLKHFQLYKSYSSSDDLMKVKSLECVEGRPGVA